MRDVFAQDLVMAKWPSRVWSCSELLRGACQVVDMGGAPAADEEVVAMKRQLLTETSSLGVEELQAMLQDLNPLQVYLRFLSYTSLLWEL